VLSEGDRKAPAGAGKIAAPPLQAPMGETLFGDFSTHLEDGGDPDALFAPVRAAARRYRDRAVVPPGARPATSPSRS
jgi:hypothetical protein